MVQIRENTRKWSQTGRNEKGSRGERESEIAALLALEMEEGAMWSPRIESGRLWKQKRSRRDSEETQP